jgi:hypothetical protein
MPNCLDMDPDEALRVLDDRTLSGHIYTDSAGSAGLPVHVVTQNPPVGTLLPLGTTVSLGVLPR